MDLWTAYWSGVAVALGLGLLVAAEAAHEARSIRSRNLAKVGLHYRAALGDWKSEGTTSAGWGFFVVFVLLIQPWGSWFIAAPMLWGRFREARARFAMPATVKRLDAVLDARELPRHEVIEALEALFLATGQPGAVPAACDGAEAVLGITGDAPSVLTLPDGTVAVDPVARRFEMLGRGTFVHEYRFDGTAVSSRVVDLAFRRARRQVDWIIRDGVLLESEVRRHTPEISMLGPIERRIAEYRTLLDWRPVRLELRFFLMAQHPGEFPFRERRRLMRAELERIELGLQRVSSVARALGHEEIRDGDEVDFRLPKDVTKEQREQIHEALDQARAEAGVTWEELESANRLARFLRAMLDDGSISYPSGQIQKAPSSVDP